MEKLVKQIKQLERLKISETINKRLKDFKEINKKGNDKWFSELCFCILTSNSKAKTALDIQNELGYKGFTSLSQTQIAQAIRKNKHRFHNTKAKYIVGARKHKNIKSIVLNEKKPREWLVENIKGLGWKEASHFLRNVGYTDYAIIDRHVINTLFENKMINQRPKTLNKQNYLEIEKKLDFLGKKLGMNQAKLDLYLWYMKTGEVLK